MSELRVSRFLCWMGFLEQVKKSMETKGFTYIETPFLVSSGAMESHLECFTTQWTYGAQTRQFQLPTSPEFHLKKALSMGLGDIFEMKTCFRNEESGPHHKPEFKMLEFYKTNISYEEFILFIENWLKQIMIVFEKECSNLLQKAELQMESAPEFFSVSLQDLFLKEGLSLKSEISKEELRSLCQKAQLYYTEGDDENDLFCRILIERIEPDLDREKVVFVKDYPPFQAALAKLSDKGWAQRFEFYWKGIELGNAYHELQDPDELKKRWSDENKKRVANNQKPHPIDEAFINTLTQMPECCGVAIGLERLFMAITGLESMNDFQLFE